MMPMSYAKLFQLMESKGLKKFDLRKAGISPTIVDRLIKGHDVNTSTITRLCRLLGCQPGDIRIRITTFPGKMALHRRFLPVFANA